MIAPVFLSVFIVVFGPVQGAQQQQFPCGVSQKKIGLKIIGGRAADPQQHPWHAAVFHKLKRTWEYACGGTLITDKFVVTARHCTLEVFDQISIEKLLIKLGLQKVDHENHNSQTHLPSAIYSLLEEQRRNDIALIELKTLVRFTEHLLPACLVTQDFATGDTGKIVGFGYDETYRISMLREVEVSVVNPYTCIKRHIDFAFNFEENQFCAGNTDGRSVCTGDSGGGLIFFRDGTMQLGAILSYMGMREDNTCDTDGYTVFVNVYKFLPWIQNITKVKVAKIPKNCGLRSTKLTWTVGIYRKYNSSWIMSNVGTVIHQRYVLTSMYEYIPDRLRVLLEKTTSDTLDDFGIRPYRNVLWNESVVHPDFSIFSGNNIVLLRLDREIQFSKRVQPVCLPTVADLQLGVPKELFGYKRHHEIVTFNEMSISAKDPMHCQTAHLQMADLSSANEYGDLGFWCLRNKESFTFTGSPVGFYVHRNGAMRFVQLGAKLNDYFSARKPGLFTLAINYTSQIDWIMDNLKP